MVLGFNDLAKITKGAIYTEEKNGYFIPYRYSKKQLEYMARPEYDYGWRFRSKISGGIHFDFFTEGETFQADMATSFAKREVQKKLEDFKEEFEAARRSDRYEG